MGNSGSFVAKRFLLIEEKATITLLLAQFDVLL